MTKFNFNLEVITAVINAIIKITMDFNILFIDIISILLVLVNYLKNCGKYFNVVAINKRLNFKAIINGYFFEYLNI